ncbi:MAG TPA: polyprenyl synthetase family protein [Candidatus Thermoplasmatota archaeon]|nr:polyprenyl synthetase family protein [Candidatus Thermoplasmatota archaeon]
MDLEAILKQRATIFDRALNGNLSAREPELFYEALRWIPLSGGKRLRPILAMLSCEAVGGVPETTIPLGIALEYLHNSTLIHDDIIDEDKWRRGLQTTHEKFGVPMAIIAGDALIGETYRMLSYMAPPELRSVTYKEIIRSIADAAKNFYEGEALDVEFANRTDVTIPQYMVMIEKKTAQLYYLAGKCGALIGRGKRIQVENMAQYGTLFGLMFQIKDDLLNILPEQSLLGKQEVGSDILNGKRTLMFTHALWEVKENEKNKMMSIVGNKNATQQDVLEVIDLWNANGSIAYAQGKLEEFREKAKECLETVDASESKDLLAALADYSVTRAY